MESQTLNATGGSTAMVVATAAIGSGGGVTMINESSDAAFVDTDAVNSTTDDSKQFLVDVIDCIQQILGLLHKLSLTVSSFNHSLQLLFLKRLNALMKKLDTLMNLSEKCNIQIPAEVVSLVDDGKNPDEFTRDVLNSCVAMNQITRGKTDAFKSLRKHLLEELEQSFPDKVESYREIRAASAAEAKRVVAAAQLQNTMQNGDLNVKLVTGAGTADTKDGGRV